MLVEDGVLVERNGRLESRAAVESLRVPATVQAVLAARLDRLERRGARDAAARGRDRAGLLVGRGRRPDARRARRASVAGHLQALVRKGLVRPDRRTFAGEDGFRFGHILIRDAAYDSMSKRLRAELHERFADWVEERVGEGAELDEILGHHLEQAHLYRAELGPADTSLAERACVLLARAGRRALAREDNHAAATPARSRGRLARPAGRRAAGGTARPGDCSAPGRSARRGGRALRPAAGRRHAAARRRVGAARACVPADLERRGLGGRGASRRPSGRRRSSPSSGTTPGSRRRGTPSRRSSSGAGSLRQMEDAALRALEHARAAADERQELWAVNALCIALAHGPTPAEEAARRCRELLARGEELGADALPLFTLAAVEAMRGRLADAWELYDRGVARGVGGVRASVSLYAEPLFELDPGRAEDALRQTLHTLDEIGIRTGRRTAAVMLAEALLARGARERGRSVAALARTRSFPVEDVTTMILAWRAEARLLGGRRRCRAGASGGRGRAQDRVAAPARRHSRHARGRSPARASHSPRPPRSGRRRGTCSRCGGLTSPLAAR